MCIDPRELNKELLREQYTLIMLEDSLHELGQCRIVTKPDLSIRACAARTARPQLYYADDLPNV